MHDEAIILIVLLHAPHRSKVLANALCENPLALIVVPSEGGGRVVMPVVHRFKYPLLFVIELSVLFSSFILELHAGPL